MKKASTWLTLVGLLAICLRGAAQQKASSPKELVATEVSDTGPDSFLKRSPHYRLRTSDVIEVDFTFSPEFNQTLTIQPDGYISMKGAGEVQAEHKTLAELSEAIGISYRSILHDPVITISLKDFDKPFFLASGQIGKPGKYELRSDTTLTAAVAIAGGFTDAAKHSQVVLFRRVSHDTVEARVFNVKHMLNSKDLQEDPDVLSGDMLYVPQSKWSKVRRYLPTSSMGVYANPNPF